MIYSPTYALHLQHLRQALELLRQHTLYAKASKCSFGKPQVEYLGHIITIHGVSTDPKKVAAMEEWPVPRTIKELRGFLGLIGYYRRFVKNYGPLSKPLTNLLKKNSFGWNEEAQQAFNALKAAMVSAPVLALPNFSKSFVVETDASGVGIGAVLMQDAHPIAYLSKALSPKHQHLSAYEKEFLAVVMAVDKWRPYLLGRHFIIKTDHFSLKYLMEQPITTPFQGKWLSKLMGFDYEICYKKGKENVVADGLSRLPAAQLTTLTVSSIDSELLNLIKQSWSGDDSIQAILTRINQGENLQKYTISQNILYRKGKVVVGQDKDLHSKLIKIFHDSPLGGHSGVAVTTKRVLALFWWKGLHKDIRNYVRVCEVCQRCKADLGGTSGLLQPLPIPGAIWTDVSMDFVQGLPKSHGKDTVLVVVDRLSKYAHFMALAHPFTAVTVAQLYFDNVFKLHGLPKTMVSDRDKIFLSQFWQELFRLQHVNIHLSTAYHPQTDGQTEVVNRSLEGYLRCMVGETPREWVTWLPLAEWWYNSNWHSAIGVTPYEVVYGQPPSLHVPYLPGDSRVEPVDRSLKAREECIEMLKYHLQRAQQRMKKQADQHRVDRQFEIGDWVFAKLQPYRQHSVALRMNQKLSPKFFGPFPVIARVGAVAYHLQLPPTAKIHQVIHVSLLKPYVGLTPSTLGSVPDVDELGLLAAEPVAVLARRLGKKGNHAIVYLLIQWSNRPKEEATWELYTDIAARFPSFNLEA